MSVEKNFNYSRQVSPSTNRAVCDRLSDEANNSNIKKVQINSQITAMISFLEVCGNVLSIILVYIFANYKVIGIITLLNSILLYFIVLPTTFLFNTSENKMRIIEHGWINMLRNLFGIVSNHTVEPNQVSPNIRKSNECSNEPGENKQNNEENELKIFTTRSSADRGKSRNELESLNTNKKVVDVENDACQYKNDSIPSTSQEQKFSGKEHYFLKKSSSSDSIETIKIK